MTRSKSADSVWQKGGGAAYGWRENDRVAGSPVSDNLMKKLC